MPHLVIDFAQQALMSAHKPESMLPRPSRIDQADLPTQRWDDPARGTIAWKTLLSGDITPSDSLVCGIAIMDAGDDFALHAHPQAEIYFGLEGEVDVSIDGQDHRLAPGVALFIPGGALHGVRRATQPVRWFYTFAVDRFDQVQYSFSDPRI